MDSPIRQYLKQKDYRRHKLFRKINRRRKAERLLAIDAPMKELRRKLKRYDGGKDESTQKMQKRPVTTGGAGYIPSTPEHSNLILKDIAYRVMSQDSYQSRYVSDIIKAALEAMSGQPYKPNYTGSFAWDPATKEEAQKDELSRDLNHLVIFGNTKKQFEPTKISGFDYSDFLSKNYGVTSLPTYKGHIENTSKVSIPTEYRPLVEYLADRPNMGYYSSGTEDNIDDYNQIIEDGTEPFKAIDDTASYRKSFRRDKNGNPELAVLDLIDYKGNYRGKYGLIAGLQGDILTKVINSPVLLDQGIPVNYSDNPKDYQWGPGWYYTLKNLVDNNKILEATDNGYEYPLVLPEVSVKGKNLHKPKKYDGGKDDDIAGTVTLPEVVVKPTFDTDLARMRINQMILDKKLRDQILSDITPIRIFPQDGTVDYDYDSEYMTANPQSNEYSKIKHLYEIWDAAGRPKITSGGNSIFDKLFTSNNKNFRDHYNPLTNSIHLNPRNPVLVSELSHAILFGDKNIKSRAWDPIPGDIKINGKDGYHRLGNVEYEAHSIIEPTLKRYIKSPEEYEDQDSSSSKKFKSLRGLVRNMLDVEDYIDYKMHHYNLGKDGDGEKPKRPPLYKHRRAAPGREERLARIEAAIALREKEWEARQKAPSTTKSQEEIEAEWEAEFKKTHPEGHKGSATLSRMSNLFNAVTQSQFPVTAEGYKEAVDNQVAEKLEKAKDYKKGAKAAVTAAELGLSGASILGAYANWRNWAAAVNATKKGIANLLQKAQLPMLVGGTLIDAAQTYNGFQNEDVFDTYYNGASAALGTAGSIGAWDIFRNRFHNAKIDRILDVMGLMQNVGDFIKFGVELYNNATKEDEELLDSSNFNSGKDSGIHIKPLNRGKFTALKKRTGKSTSWFKAHGTPALKKMATFALNARKWKHK